MGEKQPHHLAEVGFQRMAPSPALRPFIQWFWAIESRYRMLEKRREFMHSKGSLSLLFNWGDDLEVSNDCYPQSVILEGVSPHSRQVVLTGNIQAFGILFRPGGAFPFIGIPMQEVTTTDSLRPLNLFQLHEQLSEISTLQGKVEWVESWLIRLLSSSRTSSNIVPTSLGLINRGHGQHSIQHVANSICLSERQLERLFKKEVGLSPKKYARLIRLHQARIALKQTTTATLAEVAHRAGFYDQAHFNREFKETIGITPGAYICRQ